MTAQKAENQRKPYAIAATLHDAAALAGSLGPGAVIGIGPAQAMHCDILAPGMGPLNAQAINAALALGCGRYIAGFESLSHNGRFQEAAALAGRLITGTATGFMAACLATPWQGRCVFQGHLFQHGRLLGNLQREFSTELDGNVSVIGHEIVAQGAEAMARQCARLKEQGVALALLDAINHDDCTAILGALENQPLAGGAGWLAGGNFTKLSSPPLPAGRMAVICGAQDRQSLYQLGAARSHVPVFDLDFSTPSPAGAAVDWVRRQASPTPVIITSAVPPGRLTQGANAAEILAEIAAQILPFGFTRLLLAGDETAAAVLARLGITRLLTNAAQGSLLWLNCENAHENLSICIKPPAAGGRDLFLSGIEPQIRLNEPVI